MIKKGAIWSYDLKKKSFSSFHGEAFADTVIIGGGLTGILAAYLLSKAGRKVVILEKGSVGGGVTSLTTAFITQSLDTSFSDLIKMFGVEGAKEIINSHGEALKLIRTISEDYDIDCDFTSCSNYIYALSKKDLDSLKKETNVLRKLGLSVRFSAKSSELGFKNKGFLEMKNQAKFHPLKFLYGLAEETEKLGARIYEETEVTDIKSDGEKVEVHTKKGKILARKAVIATYSPLHEPLRLYFRKGKYVSYVLDLEVENSLLIEGIYEDMKNPYHYMRVEKSFEGKLKIIIGGEDHRKNIPVNQDKSFRALQSYVDKIFSKSSYTIKAKWTGPILEPSDGLAVIGPSGSENTFYATAFSGNGMTYAGIAAIMARDFVLGKQNIWEKYYASQRLPKLKSLIIKGKDYSEELVKGALKNTVGQKKGPLTKTRIRVGKANSNFS